MGFFGCMGSKILFPAKPKKYGNGLVEPWVMGKYCIVAYR